MLIVNSWSLCGCYLAFLCFFVLLFQVSNFYLYEFKFVIRSPGVLPYNYWHSPAVVYDDKDPTLHDLLYLDTFRNKDSKYEWLFFSTFNVWFWFEENKSCLYSKFVNFGLNIIIKNAQKLLTKVIYQTQTLINIVSTRFRH